MVGKHAYISIDLSVYMSLYLSLYLSLLSSIYPSIYHMFIYPLYFLPIYMLIYRNMKSFVASMYVESVRDKTYKYALESENHEWFAKLNLRGNT